MASDVAYEPDVFEPLCEALRHVCTQSHTKVLLCNGVRSPTREKVCACVFMYVGGGGGRGARGLKRKVLTYALCFTLIPSLLVPPLRVLSSV